MKVLMLLTLELLIFAGILFIVPAETMTDYDVTLAMGFILCLILPIVALIGCDD